ncbi:MAG: EAL domain-containing protein [Clostridia bacterium]|nr:EAL domain-containing protein [Clostridia bacterium]
MFTVKRKIIRLIAANLILLILFAAVSSHIGVLAEDSGRIVRVGWYESPFNTMDELGRRTGYAYQYQQKIAAYSGWKYEYVEGSWADLMQMLIDGRIDLMSDVSFTEERAGEMLFSSHPMGAEEYYIFVSPKNTEIKSDDSSTFNGKKIGVNKGSIQADMYVEWAAENGVTAELIEMTGTEYENVRHLTRGDIDMYITLDAFSDINYTVPVCKIGSSDFFFAVSKDRPEILTELNTAMSRIQTENPYYYQQLYSKYIKTSAANLYLSSEELKWVEGHGTIRVGYQDNYLSFCALDPATGKLTGALKEYLEIASDCLQNAHIDFEAFVYPTSAAALEAVKNGEIDCMFPANLTDYDGEIQGFFITAPLMSTDMSAVVREGEQRAFFKKERITVAVNAGNPNYDMFLLDHFPEWRSIYFKDTSECLQAIYENKADCLLISNYRFNNISKLCEKYNLTALSTGVEMDYCFAVSRENITLYSILTKIAGAVPDSSINAALSYYYTEDAKLSFFDLLQQNIAVVIIVIITVALLIVFLVFKNARAEKKANARLKLITATENDLLTGLYTKSYYLEYANRMYNDDPDNAMDAIVLNIERFHTVNAVNGRSFGDNVLIVISDEIRAFLSENGGIAGHAESDHFSILCTHLDDYAALYDRLQGRLDMLATNAGIRLRMGVMPWQKGMHPHQAIEQALIACKLARGRFKDHMVVFDDSLREKEKLELKMINDLQDAVNNHEFEVYYQPKFNIQSETPQLCGAEALVRWNHPELGLISPSDFIPLFEQSGHISVVDKYVWKEAAYQIALWRDKFKKDVPVSVNLSRMDVFDTDLKQNLDSILAKNGLDHSVFELEVTESAYIENAEHIIGVIEKLRESGYRIEMDDFGAGYSSLNMLSSMPVDVIKMDSAFVRNIGRNKKSVQLIELIIDIAKKINVPVVAEGVEKESQYLLLKEAGCDIVQGFYFYKPLTAKEFEAVLLEK